MIKYKCKYYPCHEDLEDCTYCYCPIYPCKIEELGGKWIKKKTWDCSDCNIIHYTAIVKFIKLCRRKYEKRIRRKTI